MIAPGTKRFKKADVAIAVPKIRFAGNAEAKKPPGTCVTKYPQKNDESTALSVATDQLYPSVCYIKKKIHNIH